MAGAATAFPRPLAERERETLDFLLSGDDRRLPDLRAQAAATLATGDCGCGCPTIDLAVDPSAARQLAGAADFEISAVTLEDGDPDRVFGLILFVRGGWLALLELAYLDTIPPVFPPAAGFGSPTVRR